MPVCMCAPQCLICSRAMKCNHRMVAKVGPMGQLCPSLNRSIAHVLEWCPTCLVAECQSSTMGSMTPGHVDKELHGVGSAQS